MKGMFTRLPPATDGELARLNHESILRRCRNILNVSFERTGVLEALIDEEQKRIQFLGDYAALDRLSILSKEILSSEGVTGNHYLAAAQIASARHHFSDSVDLLSLADRHGIDSDLIIPVSLSIDQATGKNLDSVLSTRIARANQESSIQNLVPLAALYADLGEYDKAHLTYLKAIHEYSDLSPFALAWVCFHLGMLHGEIVPEPDLDEAAGWYQAAIAYIPDYVHARVHLSEIYIERNMLDQAAALLNPILDTHDPEVFWRYAQLQEGLNNPVECDNFLLKSKERFQDLTSQHELGFADHAVEFYLGTNQESEHAIELANKNLRNRPTLTAFEAAYAAALAASKRDDANTLAAQAREKWGSIPAFKHSIFMTDEGKNE
ncbi:tetratricopeptide repeat protein [Zwartia vadi]|uniref:tetratricopeptide repeat protein n=1 Tax=Zwartia vadi TaxID=3058168 RepID=UPI0025B5EBCC|nr:tetratricopeptide repeat protein [Zwartia vadi]MDN3987895.1 tetratricopeptide repeat protein [Zwartia vadi]